MEHDLRARLHEHQAEVLDIVGHTEAMLNDTHDVPGLSRFRWVLVRAMGRYQLFKHHEVLDPSIARASPVDAQRLTLMKEACLALGAAFHEHVRKWSGSDVEAEWRLYRPAALAMMKRIRVHIAHERIEMDALLAGRAEPVMPSPATARPRQDRPTPAG